MQLIDTHTHLYMPEYGDDCTGAVERAIEAGVGHMVFPNVDLSTIDPMLALADRYPRHISVAMGLHPTEVKADWEADTLEVLGRLADGHRYVAIGEVGIDLYWDKTYEREQMLSLDLQLSKAQEFGLPVIIHCREGLQQVLEVLGGHDVRAVFHSFGGTIDDVEAIRKDGDHYFGINGIVTFKNCKVRDTLSEITLDRLLLETDSPYLAPVPHRGKRNESAYLLHTAHHIAGHLGVDIEEVARRTTINAQTFFRIENLQQS